MNFRLVANITSYVLWVEAGFLLLPLAVSVFSGEAWLPFFITAVLCVLIGGALVAFANSWLLRKVFKKNFGLD